MLMNSIGDRREQHNVILSYHQLLRREANAAIKTSVEKSSPNNKCNKSETKKIGKIPHIYFVYLCIPETYNLEKTKYKRFN